MVSGLQSYINKMSGDLNTAGDLNTKAKANVLVRSESMDADAETVAGYDFNNGINYEKMFASYLRMGFQATNLGLAINEINRMVRILTNSFIQ